MISIFLFRNPIQLNSGTYVSKPSKIKPFELMDHHGNTFSVQQLEGHWSLLFFGFSSCPMICPVTLDKLQQVNMQLPASKKLQMIFVSVDPEHDTIQHLNDYMRAYDPYFIAIRGPMSEINTLQQEFHVHVSKTPQSHGAEIILINPLGQIQAYFNSSITSQELLMDLDKLIDP